MSEGWQGWDQYAPFYDWENARTVARRDVAFWRGLARRQSGAVLELGCGTGRLALPLMKAGARLVGIDRSEPMLGRARLKARRAGLADRVRFVRGDIRRLPFRARPGFGLVMAPYGMLQSLTRERDLAETLDSVARVIRRDGVFGIDLVPDLPRWSEYKRRVTLSGSRDAQDPSDAAGDRAPGYPPRSHDVRPGVRGAPRRQDARAPLRAHVPDALGPADAPAPREGRLPGDARSSATTTAGRGIPTPTSGSSSPPGPDGHA